MKGSSLQVKFQSLKKQYDDLLEKNQNDLIKIKMREKQLNQKIESILRQKQQNERKLNLQIDSLKKMIGSLPLNSQKQLKGASLDKQMCETLRQEISCRSKQINQLNVKLENCVQSDKQKKIQILNLQNMVTALRSEIQQVRSEFNQLNLKYEQSDKNTCRIKEIMQKEQQLRIQLQKMSTLNSQLHKFNEQYQVKQKELQKTIRQLQQFNQKQKVICLNRYQTQIAEKQSILKNLKQRLLITNEDLKKELQKRNKIQISLSLKSQQCQEITKKYQCLLNEKKGDKEVKICLRCLQLDQQVELHKQMIKSVRMMLKFKQIQLQGYKKKQ